MILYVQQIEKEAISMTLERYLRLIAGAFVLAGIGILGKPLLVSLHGFRGLEPIPIRLYELVSDDDIPS